VSKNLCEQLRGVLRTVYFGDKFVDFTGGMDLGLGPAAFVGHDTMSDWQAALILLGHTSSRARASRVTEVSEGGKAIKKRESL